MRVALYGRYSSNLQNERSVDDQFAQCEARCAAEGWIVVQRYSDKAISGSSVALRSGILDLIEAAKRGEFDLVVAESLDRISRDQEETAGIYKRLKFARVGIFTLVEGHVSELHVGFKGTMNAIELQHTAARVRRGQMGSVKAGKIHGGKAYGYRTVRTTENPTGLREIVPAEAEIVRRIFSEFNSGLSTVAIAKRLNAEGIPSPTGGTWRASTITGSRKRVNGILRNTMYVGQVLYGRNFNVRDPDTGMRLNRPNDPSQLVLGEVSEELKLQIRIIDEETWTAAQNRLSSIGRKRLHFRRRPRHLLSGLVRCKKCGGPFVIQNRDRMCCSNHKDKGTCTIPHSISRIDVERRVIQAITTKLADARVIGIYRDEYIRELKEQSKKKTTSRPALLKQQAALTARLERLADHLGSEDLLPLARTAVREQINKAAEDLQILETQLAQAPSVSEMNLPADFARRLSKQLPNLRQALEADSEPASTAREILRSMIEQIVLEPTPGKESRIECPWEVTVTGPIQAVLQMPQLPSKGTKSTHRRVMMVPRGGIEPPTP